MFEDFLGGLGGGGGGGGKSLSSASSTATINSGVHQGTDNRALYIIAAIAALALLLALLKK